MICFKIKIEYYSNQIIFWIYVFLKFNFLKLIKYILKNFLFKKLNSLFIAYNFYFGLKNTKIINLNQKKNFIFKNSKLNKANVYFTKPLIKLI